MLDGKRARKLPDVPTFEEQGVRGLVSPWLGIFVAGGTPDAIAARLHQEFGKVLQDPGVHEKLEDDGMHPVGSSAAEFVRQIADEIAQNCKLVQDLKITVD